LSVDIFLLHDQYRLVAFYKRISLVVAKVVPATIPGSVYIGEVVEIKAVSCKFGDCYRSFSRTVERCKYELVLFQYPVDFSDGIVAFRHQFVVVGIPALIAAILLVGPSSEDITAFKAFPFRHIGYALNLL
jgi:hypothetical protein